MYVRMSLSSALSCFSHVSKEEQENARLKRLRADRGDAVLPSSRQTCGSPLEWLPTRYQGCNEALYIKEESMAATEMDMTTEPIPDCWVCKESNAILRPAGRQATDVPSVGGPTVL